MYLYSGQKWAMHCLMSTKTIFIPVRNKLYLQYLPAIHSEFLVILARLNIDGADVPESGISASFVLFLQCSVGRFN